jgi:hypothetical protein
MKYHIFSVYDEKAKAYITPFFLPEIGQATRVFGDMVNDTNHQFGMHPQDYTLFKIGDYDDGSGTTESNKQTIANGIELVEEQPKKLNQMVKDIYRMLKELTNGTQT